jgi:hypothetical protein
MLLSSPAVVSYLGAEVLEGVALDGVDAENRTRLHSCESAGQEKLLAAALLLNDLNQARLQLLDRGDVTRQNTHITGLGGKVDLDAVPEISSVFARSNCGMAGGAADVHIL